VLGVDVRVWVDLEGVVVDGGVLEQAVERVEHLVGEKEEELPRKSGGEEKESGSAKTSSASPIRFELQTHLDNPP